MAVCCLEHVSCRTCRKHFLKYFFPPYSLQDISLRKFRKFCSAKLAHVTVHCGNMNVAVCGDEHGHVCAMKAKEREEM